MISDPAFSNVVAPTKIGSVNQVSDHWFVDLKSPAAGANPVIGPADGGGLEVKWDAPVDRARVWQHLDGETLAADGSLDLSVNVNFAACAEKSVEWIAILEERDREVLFHTKLKVFETRLRQGLILTGVASGIRFEPNGKYRFCIHFAKTPNQVIMRSVEAKASPTPLAAAQSTKRKVEDSALLVEQLKVTLNFDDERVNPAVIEDGVRTLAERHDRQSLLQLLDFVGGIQSPVERAHPLRTQVIYHYARTMLNMNASETAYIHLRALLDNPLLLEPLSNEDIRRVRKLTARACVRTGRAEEAVQIQRDLLRDNPLDWEPYYQLGMLQAGTDAQARRLFHTTAETLSKSMPSTVLTAIAEAYINEGAPDEAIERALVRLKAVRESKVQARGDDKELYLTLANAWLAVGQRDIWAAHLQRYFANFGLAGPDIGVEEERGQVLYRRTIPEGSVRSGPLITVVMTSFNASDTLEYAVRSVLDQTHANLRLVIVDDASEDGSRDVITRLASEDDRIAPMFNDENMGTYCSKNRALREFESDFYTFHDSDDWMHPERLSIHLAATRDDVRFTTSMWIRMDDYGRAVVRAAGSYLHDNPASTFFDAGVLESVGFFDSVRTGADSEFTWRARHILGQAAVHHIRKPLAIGLNRVDSLTRSGPAAFDEFRFSQVRLNYWESWAAWHNDIARRSALEEMFVPYPLDQRRFTAPGEILPTRALESEK